MLYIATQKGRLAVLYIEMVYIEKTMCIVQCVINLRNFQGQFDSIQFSHFVLTLEGKVQVKYNFKSMRLF